MHERGRESRTARDLRCTQSPALLISTTARTTDAPSIEPTTTSPAGLPTCLLPPMFGRARCARVTAFTAVRPPRHAPVNRGFRMSQARGPRCYVACTHACIHCRTSSAISACSKRDRRSAPPWPIRNSTLCESKSTSGTRLENYKIIDKSRD